MKIWSALLSWLTSTFGVSETAARFVMIALLLLAILAVGLWWWRSSRQSDRLRGPVMAFPGAGPASMPRQYSPKNVGNDASARPWEHGDLPEPFEPVVTAVPSGQPEDFDRTGFLEASKANFVLLQEAWDRADIPALRAMMTDEMADLIQVQLSAREQSAQAEVRPSEVVVLEAKLLGIEDLMSSWMASVEFSGLLREESSAGPNPFREVWSITRPKTGTQGWLVAGVQAMQ